MVGDNISDNRTVVKLVRARQQTGPTALEFRGLYDSLLIISERAEAAQIPILVPLAV